MRSDMRLSDLRSKKSSPEDARLMNVTIPVEVSDAIERIAKETRTSKTNVVIALFNEGLDVAREALKHVEPRTKPGPAPKAQRCSAPGCTRARVAKGLCTTHYQRARRD